jgi:hypothetical protein
LNRPSLEIEESKEQQRFVLSSSPSTSRSHPRCSVLIQTVFADPVVRSLFLNDLHSPLATVPMLNVPTRQANAPVVTLALSPLQAQSTREMIGRVFSIDPFPALDISNYCDDCGALIYARHNAIQCRTCNNTRIHHQCLQKHHPNESGTDTARFNCESCRSVLDHPLCSVCELPVNADIDELTQCNRCGVTFHGKCSKIKRSPNRKTSSSSSSSSKQHIELCSNCELSNVEVSEDINL